MENSRHSPFASVVVVVVVVVVIVVVIVYRPFSSAYDNANSFADNDNEKRRFTSGGPSRFRRPRRWLSCFPVEIQSTPLSPPCQPPLHLGIYPSLWQNDLLKWPPGHRSSFFNHQQEIYPMALNAERLASLFTTLCEIDSPSTREGRVAALLRQLFAEEFPEASISEDQSAAMTGSDCGNLLVRFIGNLPLEPVFFNCHMDTVQPGEGVEVHRQGSIFTSLGDTVLGGDDKAGIAILIEVMRSLHEDGHPYGPVELIFTTCEEIGLLGAKHFDTRILQANMGYALDSTGVDQVIIGAPAANHIEISINGLAAHAGLNPEQGINAVHLAAKALAVLKLGRLDEESTANIGVITGGTATNIVPASVVLQGEVRSHSPEKLLQHTRRIEDLFAETVAGWNDPTGLIQARPSLTFHATSQYPGLRLTEQDAVIQRINRAATSLSRQIRYIVAGGGSDANIFTGYGVKTAILSTGMQMVHSTGERIDLNDMMRTAQLVEKILTN
jgi:tripeptide aminopeptidase